MTPEERAAVVCDQWHGLAQPLEKIQRDIAAAIRAAVEAERAECAKIADGYARGTKDPSHPIWIAKAIRARSQPANAESPTLAELRGLMPGATGELSAVEFVRRLRDGEFPAQ